NRPNAFVWQDGLLFNLNASNLVAAGWMLEEARAISDRGYIVGAGQFHGRHTAFLYDAGSIKDLGVLAGGARSYALGINGLDLIVGASTTEDGSLHAILWDGSLRDLNDLIPSEPTWELREARSINDAGQIVGWGKIGGHEHAFL